VAVHRGRLPYAYAQRNANSDSLSDIATPFAFLHANGNAKRDAQCYGYAYRHANSDSQCIADIIQHFHIYSYSHAYAYHNDDDYTASGHAYSNGHRNDDHHAASTHAYAYGVCYPDGYIDAYGTGVDRCAAERQHVLRLLRHGQHQPGGGI